MAQLEAQILTTDANRRRVGSSSSAASSATSSATSTSTTVIPSLAEPTNEPSTSINGNESATDAGEAATVPTAELNDNEKRWLDDILSVGAYNFEKTIEQQRSELKQQQQQQVGEEQEQQQEPVPVQEQQQQEPEQE
ncbi:myotubularin-related protein DDB_G0290005-like [Drosophila montana]|uniref:myotubularin-related protein DDB_G0290005-like n=1 Tax=Drosophila montana TaxID=40370 RepID=UPI00313ED15F